jgi:hypothetical protein
MIAACVASIFMFATAAPGMPCKSMHLADLSRRIDALGNRVGNVTQRMDDGAERMNGCLYGVKRCHSPRWKGVRNGLDKFSSGPDKVWNRFDEAGDKVQEGLVAK